MHPHGSSDPGGSIRRLDSAHTIDKPASKRKRIFQNIYDTDLWKYGSGPGSLPENTAGYREFLSQYMRENQVQSVLDVGCGDWQSSRLIDWTGIDYVGIDIVPEVITGNIAKFRKPGVKFLEIDAVEEDLPGADLAIVKDCLQHLSNDSVKAVLAKLNRCRLILACNDSTHSNGDISDGGHRFLNLESPPFNLKCRVLFKFMHKQVVEIVPPC